MDKSLKNKGLASLILAGSLSLCGCLAGGHPPAIPAYEAAPGVRHLWPEGAFGGFQEVKEGEQKNQDELSLAAAPLNQKVDNRIVGVVGERVITLKEFDFNFLLGMERTRGKMAKEELFKQSLLQLVDRELLLQEATRREIQVDEMDVDERMNQIQKNYPGGIEVYRQRLEGMHQSIEEIREDVKNALLVEKVERELFSGYATHVTPKEILDFYHLHTEEFSQPERREARLILFFDSRFENESACKKAAFDAYELLQKGADFAKLAQEKSQGPRSAEGGYQGFVERGVDLMKPIEDALFELKDGSYSAPFRIPPGFVIVKCLKTEAPHNLSFDQVQPHIRNRIHSVEMESRRRAMLDQLKKASYVATLSEQSYFNYRQSLR